MPTFAICNAGGITAELHGRTAKTAHVGIAIRQILQSRIIFRCVQFDSKHRSQVVLISIGCHVVDQGSGDE